MVDFTTEFTVDAAPSDVFATIGDVRSWWTGDIEGDSTDIGDVFSYRYEQLHRSVQRVTESRPDRRVVWHVDDAHLAFTADPHEWTGTDIAFDIEPRGEGSLVRFTHRGLTPDVECFDACSSAWSHYIGTSLRAAIIARAA